MKTIFMDIAKTHLGEDVVKRELETMGLPEQEPEASRLDMAETEIITLIRNVAELNDRVEILEGRKK